ncbi:hypothetical protein HELRODRAFT_172606 [Helobdella robusta]|uniref:BACK domain-containing protein n=1 Tax=Helobdella robusta TaxID=6412 RepID=T1F5L9_HELRO|nr:hypothetical protein HELRODRAFT_172606 [Helobdella robusta]ESO04250.1 hypothetical protein HELRODRAFT_172606 [Helobdella robusta]
MDERIEMDVKKADCFDDFRKVVLISMTGGRYDVDGGLLFRASRYYEALVNSGMRDAHDEELTLGALSDESLNEIREFLSTLQSYKNNLVLQRTMMKSLESIKEGLIGASYLQICCMSDLYQKLMFNYLKESTYADILKWSSECMLTEVFKKVREFVLENFRNLELRSDLLTLAPDDVCYLLESDFFNAESEFDIFNFVIRWITADKSRKQHAEKLLTQVRYSLMTNSEKKRSSEILNEHGLNICKDEIVVDKFRSVGTIYALGSSTHGRMVFYQGVQSISVYNFMKFSENENKSPRLATLKFKTSESVKPPMPELGFKTCMVDNCLYLAGGSRYSYFTTNNFFVYNPATSTLTKRCSMYVPRGEFYFGELAGQLYAVSGRWFGKRTDTVEKYIPEEDRWLTVAPLPVATYSSGGCTCNGSIYISGGLNKFGSSNQVWRYSPDENQWTEMAQMLTNRSKHIMTSMDRKVIVIGGIRDSELPSWHFVNSGEIYDFEANQWTYLLTLKKPVFDSAFFTMNNSLYILGREPFSRNGSIDNFIQKINLSKYLEMNNTSGNGDSNINNDDKKFNDNNNVDGCQIFSYEADRSLIYHFVGIVITSK